MDINSPQNFYHIPENVPFHCYIVNVTAEHAYWQSENPLSQALPLLVWQLAFVIMINRIIFYVLKPFNVPRIVADILAGILIGPSALSKTHFFAVMFPLRSVMIVETVAYWALTCHLFLTGLEMDLTSAIRLSNRVIRFAIFIIVLPFVIGIFLYFAFFTDVENTYRNGSSLFWAATLSVTSYPIVIRILAEQKLLQTDFGRLAMSISLVNELATWALLAILIPARISAMNTILSVISTGGFTVFCVAVVRPCLSAIIKKSSNGDSYSEYYLCFVLVSVSFFSLISDMLGTTSIVGAFVFGLIMPDRVLASVLLEKFEDFVTAYLLPLFFTSMGRRVDIWSIESWSMAVFMIAVCCFVKIGSVLLASHYYKVSRKHRFALGVLMNSKGILALIILNMGLDKEYLNKDDYLIMVVAILVMTGVIPSMMSSIFHPNKRLSHYKQRTIQNARPNTEFRILTCFQSTSNVPGMINLLDSTNATKESPLCVFALHLVELTGRASAMLIVHNPGRPNSRKSGGYSEQIINSLDTYSALHDHVTIYPLTALSPFVCMHEDICGVAEDKEVSLLILPFHKLPTSSGKLEEDGSTSFRGVNLNVLVSAPCSVGIFVDKGFGVLAESNLQTKQILMLFVGGPDDREALACAWRIGMGHGISLKVVRFLPGEMVDSEAEKGPVLAMETHQSQVSLQLIDRQRRLDDEFVNEFRLKTAGKESITYEEKVLNDDEELIASLKEMHNDSFDLKIVGRSEGMKSPLTAGLMDWCEYPELGVLGDLLITSSFAQGSVLVVQQYNRFRDEEFGDELYEDGSFDSSSTSTRREQLSENGAVEMKPFANIQKSKDQHHHLRHLNHGDDENV